MILASFVSSCGVQKDVTRATQYARMYEEKPISLLVMPPINNTANVEAKDLLYTSINKPTGRGWLLCHLSAAGHGCAEG